MVLEYTSGTKKEPQAIPTGSAPTFAADISEFSTWLAAGRTFRRAATQAALIATTGNADNDLGIVDNIDGGWWRYDGSVPGWRMYGEPRFTNTAARDAAITTPHDGMRAIAANVLYMHNGSAWVRLSNLYAALTKSADQTLTTANTEYAITFDGELSDIAAMHDNVTNNTRITVPIAGMYEISYAGYHAQTTGTGYAYLRKNGATPILGSVDRRAGFTGGTPLRQTVVASLAANDYVELITSNSVAATPFKGPSNAGVAIEAFGATMSIRYLGPVS